jgi:hypothetical protein
LGGGVAAAKLFRSRDGAWWAVALALLVVVQAPVPFLAAKWSDPRVVADLFLYVIIIVAAVLGGYFVAQLFITKEGPPDVA